VDDGDGGATPSPVAVERCHVSLAHDSRSARSADPVSPRWVLMSSAVLASNFA
jgi:hypothetical protein